MTVYGSERAVDDDLAALRSTFGSWADRDVDTAALVDELRSGRRLEDSP